MPRHLFKNGLVWQWHETTRTGVGATGSADSGWFMVEDGRIQIVGSRQPPSGLSSDIITDLHGQLVLPGLIDSHIHVGYMGESLDYADLSSAKSIDELQKLLKKHCAAHRDKSWIIGVAWDQSLWSEGRYPSRQDLDEVESERPVFLFRTCWHIITANTQALQAANISLTPGSSSHVVEGGIVDLDGNGIPTGVLRENATLRVINKAEEPDQNVRRECFGKSLRTCVEKGLTAVQTNDVHAWDIYKQLQQEDDVPLRVFLTINHGEMAASKGPPSGAQDGLLSCGRVKLFSDGSLGAETAALREPYVGSENTGVLIHQPDELTSNIASAHAAGFQLEIHAIGDRALETVLDSFQRAGVEGTDRPIATHCQVMGDDLIHRMADMGVIANIQPSFVATDSRFVQQRIAKHVQRTSYCWKTLMAAGVMCAGGSDAPIEDCSPLHGMYDAIFRLPHTSKPKQDHEGGEGQESSLTELEEDIFLPHERLSFAEALWLYSIGGAYACRTEDKMGRIEPGHYADFVVIDKDVSRDPAALLRACVKQVWVAGETRLKDANISSKQAKVDGPFVPGKNGRLMSGMRSVRCCGH